MVACLLFITFYSKHGLLFITSPYCLGTDASNHGHRKLFPVCIRYFTDELHEVVLDFYENSFEDSTSIKNCLIEKLNSHNIDLKLMTSYRADNASVNYGVNQSVFTLLQQDGLNLIEANCNDHVLHNCGKHALKTYSLDIENIVMKVYAEFSVSAKNVESLKGEFEEADLIYQSAVRHAVTRWLTLFEALSRLIKNMRPIKTYFLSIGEDKCHRVIWHLFGDQADEIADDDEPTLNELKLYFLHSFLAELHGAILALQSNSTLACHLHSIIVDLKNSFRKKISDRFFGMTYLLSKRKQYLTSNAIASFEKEALTVYERGLEYLDKWFPSEKEVFYKTLEPLSLDAAPSMEEILTITEQDFFKDKCPKPNDDLFKELRLLESVLPQLSGSTLDKWTNSFANTDAPVLKQIFQVFISIPVSNAFVERVFSVMENIWVDNRNRLLIDTIKAELVVFFNLKYTCKEFYSVICKDKKLSSNQR